MNALLMANWFWWIVLPLAALLLVYFAARQLAWTIVGFGLLALYVWFAPAGLPVKVFLVSLFTGLYSLLGIPALRRPLVTARFLDRFREALLPMSAPERAVVTAGSFGWDRELCSGRPRWRKLLQLEPCRLTDAERAFVEGPVDELCAQLDDHAINHVDNDLPARAWELLRSHGFFGLAIPVEHGGKGFGAAGVAAVITKIGTRSASAALTVATIAAGAPVRLLLEHGTTAQQARWLPRLARGEDIACFALSCPDAGSDVASITDTGMVVRGDDGALMLRLDFDKRYVALAPHATLVVVVFKLVDPERLLGGDERRGISIALLEAGAAGVEKGARHALYHLGFAIGPIRGRGVLVPLDAIVGGVETIGQGWSMLAELASDGRALVVPSLCAAAAKRVSRVAGAYARIRYQFNTYIGQFEGVQELLASIAGHACAIESVRHLALVGAQQGGRATVLAAACKHTSSERCRELVASAMDLFAGSALCLGPRNLLGEYGKLATVAGTLEGANVLLRNVVLFAQGIVRCHPYLRAELDAVTEQDSIRAMAAFDRACIRHVGFLCSNALRTLTLGLTRGWLVPVPLKSRILAHQYQQVSRFSAAFALAADVLLLSVSGHFKRHERLSARLADVWSELHVASAVLLYAQMAPDESARHPARWVLGDCITRIARAFDALCSNLPQRSARVLLRRLIFPYGHLPRPPRDALDARVARVLLVPSSSRDRLSAGMYVPSDPRDPLSRLEHALDLVIRSTPALRKLRDAEKVNLIRGETVSEQLECAFAAGVLNGEEAQLLREAELARHEVLRVDEFPA